MKLLLINGSPRPEGNTSLALKEVATAAQAEGIETETLWIGNKPVQGCVACYQCVKLGHCVFRDEQTLALERAVQECDALVIGSPVYFAGPAGSLCALLDRLFFSQKPAVQYKPAACVCVCRRGGASAAFDRLNKYFSINNMPVVGSQYWNMVYGAQPGEAALDAEGMQTMRTLGRNMAWMLKNLHSGAAPTPTPEVKTPTNFIR